MKKNLIVICHVVCLIGFITVLLGCEQPSNEPVTPKIIRKKIRVATDKKTKPPHGTSVRASRGTPASTQPVPAKQAPEPPRPAQKPQAPVVAQNPATPAPKAAVTKTQKPSLKPKSDISIIRTPSPKRQGTQTAPSQPAAPPASQTTIARSAPEDRPIYDPKGKIDPFEPLFREKPTVAMVKTKRKKRIPRTPLEKIDLSQLKLVGIILASSGNKALVEESNGKGYVIKRGTYIGTNAGKVVQIQKNKVIVAEEYEDVRGNVSVRNKELKLPKPPGEF